MSNLQTCAQPPAFKMAVDHSVVPDRAEAARWYAERVWAAAGRVGLDFWATGFEKGGPLQISADGGQTMLALFEASAGHPVVPPQTGVAFSVDAGAFMTLHVPCPAGFDNPHGETLVVADLVDYDMLSGRSISPTRGETSQLNCYDYEQVRSELVEAPTAVKIKTVWRRELYMNYLDSKPS